MQAPVNAKLQHTATHSGIRRRCGATLLLLSLGWASAFTAAAQTPAASGPQVITPQRDVPRATMRGYLEACRAGDHVHAAEYLDLRVMPRATRGPVLARQLKTVLDRTLWVDLDQLSDVPEGDRQDGLPAHRDLVGMIRTSQGQVPILLERLASEGGQMSWKVASATVAQIPALHEEFGVGRLGEYLPPVFFQLHFLEIQLWQWLALLVIIGLATALSWAGAAVFMRLWRPVSARSRLAAGDWVRDLAVGPLRLLIAVALFSTATFSLGLAVPVQMFFAAVQKTLAIVAVTWLLVRLIAVAARTVEERLAVRDPALAVSVVPLGQRAVQALVIALAVLAVLQNLGINVTGIIAGLGIGGLAVALAAQKTVENLFGGVTLIADQPVRVGDFCRFGDKIGTVEHVGLRSTRIRTLDRTLVTVPNGAFAAMQLENFGKRDRIWFHTKLGLRYETTSDQLRYVLVELKKLLVSHPKVHPDPARPRFVALGNYSLDIEIFAYILTSDYDEFLAVQEDLLLRIMDLIQASGTGFAFPSQTIYLGKDTGLDKEKGAASEAQLRRWREAHSLGLPYFRPEQLSVLRGTLPYPPEGSALRK